ncbi:MAG: 50S ribosomal protein L11 methyltransferase [gamma proteobacterium symbiont of Bathyaustriella thionipta]|nr:50S ribosomal protein L11 methyltransferase [gamma proteobacterium symbiont of Bathyaustriella thionipta]
MSWLQAHLLTDAKQAPLLELVFENLGALSVSMTDFKDEPQLEPAPGEIRLWSNTRVSGLFSGDTDADALRSAINQHLNSEVTRQLTLEVLEDQQWERAWLDRFHPMRFGRRLWICPHGQQDQIDQEPAITVMLDPGLAFGTGSHPTTDLCLQWLDEHINAHETVLDYGCGSGILAIAALALGAQQAVAVDYDPQALIATQANALGNGVSDRLHSYSPQDCPAQSFDRVVANILAAPLIDLAETLAGYCKTGGRIALSGILTQQADDVMQAYRRWFDLAEVRQQDDWCLIHGRKR